MQKRMLKKSVFLLIFFLFIFIFLINYVDSLPPPPSISLTANPDSILSGSGTSSSLSWSVSNVNIADQDWCTKSWWDGTGSRFVAFTDNEIVSPSSTTDYTLTCSNKYGSSEKTVNVKVRSSSVSLDVNPSSINSGSQSLLSWVSNDILSCSAFGDWSGTKATSGQQTTGVLTSSKNYGLNCPSSTTYTTSYGYQCSGMFLCSNCFYAGDEGYQSYPCSADCTQAQAITATSAYCPGGDIQISALGKDCYSQYYGSGGDIVYESVTCREVISDSATVSVSESTTYNLQIIISGTGTVTDTVSGRSCSSSCTLSLPIGNEVNLETIPVGATWGGECSGKWTGDEATTSYCTFLLISNKVVTATFPGGPSVSPSPYIFPDPVAIGSQSSKSFIITNTGSEPITGTISFTEIVNNPFFLNSTNYNAQPGDTDAVTISFRPSTAGTVSRTARFTNSNGAYTDVQLTGTGVSGPTTILSCTPDKTYITRGETVTFTVSASPSDGTCILNSGDGGNTGACTRTSIPVTYNTVGTYSASYTKIGTTATANCGTQQIIVTAGPTINYFTATPSSTQKAGDSSALSWDYTDTSECTGTGFSTGADKSTYGSAVVNPTSTTTYTLTCKDAAGHTVTASTTVTVAGAPPSSYNLEVTVTGAGGYVWDYISDNYCYASDPQPCIWTIGAGNTISLTTSPTGGMISGACSGTTTCDITMNANQQVAIKFPILFVSPLSYTFPNPITIGSNAFKDFSVNNIGEGTLTGSISIKELDGSDSTIFSCANCGYSFGSGEGSLKEIKFTPTVAGKVSRTATFSNTLMGAAGAKSVSLTGTGQNPPATISCTADKTSITKGGMVTFTLSASPSTGTCTFDSKDGGAESIACSTITKTHTYNTAGTYSPTYVKEGTTANCGTITVTCTNCIPTMSVTTPNPRAYGDVVKDTTKELPTTITNTGGGTLTGMATVTGTGFSCISGCGTTYSLTSGQSHTVTVRFSPTAVQAYTGTAHFTNTAVTPNTYTDVSLTGNGVPTAKPTVDLTADPMSINSGGSSTLTWNVLNANSCTGSWTVNPITTFVGGTTTVHPTSTTTYTLTCTNGAGSTSDTATVSVNTPTVCGDGAIQSPNSNNQYETCDDGDTSSGDGCSSSCQIETGWTCNGEPSVCVPVDQCVGISLCSNYTDSAKCNADVCSVGDESAPITVNCLNPNIDCGCSWDASSSTCESSWVIIAPSLCGNKIIEPGETCDTGLADPFNGKKCINFDSSTGGNLICDPVTCSINVSLCTGGVPGGSCGDAVININTGETCDTGLVDPFNGLKCTNFDSFTGGTLKCNNAKSSLPCQINTSLCTGGAGPTKIGSCTITQDTSDDCSDGFLSFSWTGIWIGESSPEQATCEAGGTDTIPCPAQIQLPFISTVSIIAIVIIAVLIYFIISKKGKKRR